MQSSFSEAEYVAKKKQTRRDCFLAELALIVPWQALERALSPFYPKGGGAGRPPMGLNRMLCMVVQQCFGLFDEGMEDAIYDARPLLTAGGIRLAPAIASTGPARHRAGYGAVRDGHPHATQNCRAGQTV